MKYFFIALTTLFIFSCYHNDPNHRNTGVDRLDPPESILYNTQLYEGDTLRFTFTTKPGYPIELIEISLNRWNYGILTEDTYLTLYPRGKKEFTYEVAFPLHNLPEDPDQESWDDQIHFFVKTERSTSRESFSIRGIRKDLE